MPESPSRHGRDTQELRAGGAAALNMREPVTLRGITPETDRTEAATDFSAPWPEACSSLGMSKPIPPVQKYMTTAPHSIGGDQTLATAARLMREHHIRHLPVLSGGRLRGLLTDRDLKLVETFRDVDPTTTTVDEAMTEEPYTASPETPLDEVVSTMASGKYGSAVIVQNQRVVGIFTTVDACRALSELLKTRLQH